MPILGPGGVTHYFINDLVDEVVIKIGNRTSKRERAKIWLRDAILDIASNPDYRDDFVELQILGDLLTLTANVQEYDETSFLPSGNVVDATLDIFIWTDPPTNSKRRQLTPTSYQDADRSTAVQGGLPTQWYRFGGSVGFQLFPDAAYQVQSRILRQHPINNDDLGATEVLLPRDWHIVLVFAAAELGFAELQEFEKAAGIHTFLHGDPQDPSEPGLIYSRKKKLKRENWRREGALRPVVRGYSSGRNY